MKQRTIQLNLLGLLLLVTACSSQIKPIENIIIVYQKEEIGYSLKLSLDSLEILSNVVLPKVGV